MRATYPTYKSTSIPWPKKIPSTWELVKIASVFRERRETVSDKDFAPLSVTMQGIVPQLETAAKTDNGDNRKKVCKGDFVINSRSDRKGSAGISPLDGSVSVISIVLKPSKKLHERYVDYLLTNYYFQEEFYRYGKGIVADLWSTKFSSMKGMFIPLPPLTEQTAIANYLDAKSEQINRFIEKKQKLIALLKEQKQAVINELLEDKDGKWERRKLKYCVTKVGSGITPSGGASVYKDFGIPLLRSQNIHNDKLELSDVAFISQDVHDSMSGSKVKAGDVLLNITGGSLGRCYFASEDLGEANVNQHVSIIRPHSNKVRTEFLQLLLISEIGSKQIWREQTGSGREGLNGGAIKNFVFPMPSLEEQVEMITAIRKGTSSIDSAIFQIEKEVEKVKELKQSLIAEVVTGRIKVV